MSAVVLSGGHVLGGSAGVFNVGAGGGGGGAGSTAIFNYTVGNLAAQVGGTIHNAYEGAINGTSLEVPYGGMAHEGCGFWYTTQVNASAFTTSFNFTINAGGFNESAAQTAGHFSSVQAITFCVQNSNTTTNPSGNSGDNCAGDANLGGYGWFTVGFDGTASQSGSVVTISATSYAFATVGMILSGSGVISSSVITSFGTYTIASGVGTVNVSTSGTVGSGSVSGVYNGGPPLTQGTSPGNSIAVKFDANSYQAQYAANCQPSTTGLYINGGPQTQLVGSNDLTPYAINFYNNHSFNCTITYDGSILTMTIADTTSGAQGRYTWPVNIPSVLGGNMAYVGFTGGQFYTATQISNGANNLVNSWSFQDASSTIYAKLSAPNFSVAPGSYGSTQTVSLSGPVGASIYYTTNGLLPTTASTLYSSPITVSSNQVINAVAIQSGFTDSYVATGNYQIASSHTINFSSGFSSASNLIKLTGYAYFSGSNIVLTDTTSTGGAYAGPHDESGAAWYAAPVSISTFTTNFNFQMTNAGDTVGQSQVGMCFVIQNQPNTTNLNFGVQTGGFTYLGGYGDTMGYGNESGMTPVALTGGLANSIAIKFDPTNNSTGLYQNGDNPSDATPQITITGLTLTAGNLLTCSLSYNGTTLSMTLTDTVTSGVFNQSWTVNIPSIVGANTAYVGFTGSQYDWWANQLITSWTF
jgi:hypothetical protein